MGAKENLSAVYRKIDSNLGGNLSRIGLVAAVAVNLGAIGCGTTTNSSSNIEATPTTKAEQLAATQTSTPLVVIPTETPAPPTATPTEVPKKSENILPEYSVYFGSMTQPDTKAKGTVIIANIPGYPNQIYGFFEADRTGAGYLYDINKVEGNNLEAGGKIKILLKDSETLSGRLERFSAASPVAWDFEIKRYGTGRAAAIEAAKKLWAKEVVNDPNLWQNVPEATILGVGFRKIELP